MSKFIITEEWIRDHGTKGMGYSKAQHKAIGSNGLTGWKSRAIGKTITEAKKRAFENGKTKKGKYIARKERVLRKQVRTLKDLLKRVDKRLDESDSIKKDSDIHELIKVTISTITDI